MGFPGRTANRGAGAFRPRRVVGGGYSQNAVQQRAHPSRFETRPLWLDEIFGKDRPILGLTPAKYTQPANLPAASSTIMNWTHTALTERLGIRYPIIQAPLAGGPGTPQLVAAVSNAGGLGTLTGSYLHPEPLRQAIAEVRGQDRSRSDRPRLGTAGAVPRRTGAVARPARSTGTSGFRRATGRAVAGERVGAQFYFRSAG